MLLTMASATLSLSGCASQSFSCFSACNGIADHLVVQLTSCCCCFTAAQDAADPEVL
jgi:hypothetical protein